MRILNFDEILLWGIAVVGAVHTKIVFPLFSRLNNSTVRQDLFWKDVSREKFAGNHCSIRMTKTCSVQCSKKNMRSSGSVVSEDTSVWISHFMYGGNSKSIRHSETIKKILCLLY